MKPKGLGRGLSALLADAELDKGAGALEVIPVRDIKPNPQQPRHTFKREELEELAASIAGKGLLQPLLVRRAGHGWELIAGERRLRAAKMAGLDEVPCRVLDVKDENELLELSLVENLQREDLNPVELAEGYRALAGRFKLTQEQIAQRVGKERATVANSLRLLELPEPLLKSLRDGEISAGHAKVILSLSGAARQSGLWKRIVRYGLSVRQSEEAARSASGAKQTARAKARRAIPPHLRPYIDRLRQSLGTQVHIDKRGKKGVIRIEYYSEQELERLVDLIARED